MTITPSQAAPLYIVHTIDTEGPLYEPLDAIFDRLNELYGVDGLSRTTATLAQLRNKTIPLDGLEDVVADTVALGRSCLGTWDQIDAMLDRVMAPDFRNKMLDSRGRGWAYNWFCMDHAGFINNPRRRDLGYHNIFDHYAQRLTADQVSAELDEMHFHFHPVSTYRDAHRCATHYLRTDTLYQVLCRKIIEREFFPDCYRAGFQAERPDSHWFLEQWIPFDYSNMALDDNSALELTADFRKGRSGNWRRAPADWSVYHPDHDDYQRPGRCRRLIARTLNISSRVASIDVQEMEKGFARAAAGEATIVGVCSHDFRDLGPEVDHVRALIKIVAARYPEVPICFAGAREAMRAVAVADEVPEAPPLRLSVKLHRASDEDVAHIEVRAAEGQLFGSQPFLAIETHGRHFIHDNFDFGETADCWYYAFHQDTLPLADVKRIGVAGNDFSGHTSVAVLDI